MAYVQSKNLDEIIAYIDLMIERVARGEDVTSIAYRIVGDTIANNTVDVEQYYDKYPELEVVSLLAAELEVMEGCSSDDKRFVNEKWQQLLDNFHVLKYKIQIHKENGTYLH